VYVQVHRHAFSPGAGIMTSQGSMIDSGTTACHRVPASDGPCLLLPISDPSHRIGLQHRMCASTPGRTRATRYQSVNSIQDRRRNARACTPTRQPASSWYPPIRATVGRSPCDASANILPPSQLVSQLVRRAERCLESEQPVGRPPVSPSVMHYHQTLQ